METSTAEFEPQAPQVAYVAPAAPKRGPEPLETVSVAAPLPPPPPIVNVPEPIELPVVSADVVEAAKDFAATVVRPSTEAEVISEHAEQRAVEHRAAFPVISMLDSETLTKIVASPEIAEALAAEGLQLDQTEIARAIEENKQRADASKVFVPEWDETIGSGVESQSEPVELEDVTPESYRDLKIGINASFEEVASLLLSQQQQIDQIEKRLEEHNRRGGHKI